MENIQREKLKIMQIAPFGLPISPNIRYGGIEQVIRDLDNTFVDMGHSSYVAATGDSKTKGILLPTIPQSSWVSKKDKDGWKYKKKVELHDEEFEKHCSKALEYIIKEQPDIIHDHMGFIRSKAFESQKNLPPILTTLHGPLNNDNLQRFKDLEKKIDGRNVRFNSISESQRRDFSKIVNVDYVVLNAVDIRNYSYSQKGEGYFFSLGLISPSKGIDIALDVAKELEKKIIVGGPVHVFVPEIRDYWNDVVKKKFDKIEDKEISAGDVGKYVNYFMNSSEQSIYIGELNSPQKKEWYKRADAFFHPIRWKEPFGLVMIEAMATGTPVVAYANGAIPEVVKHKETGYVAELGNFESFCDYAAKVDQISRRRCREHVEENFSIERQARDYLDVYRDIISQNLDVYNIMSQKDRILGLI